MRRRGVFIVFEGIDGSGKTYHLKKISEDLRNLGHYVVSTKEPSQNLIGNFIHRYIRQFKTSLLPETETLLFTADRLEHVKRVIIPALNKSHVVISDRYFYSSIAYQGASGVDREWIKELNKFAPKPDLCFLFDILPDYSLYRRNRKKTKFEEVEFLRKVRNIYNSLIDEEELIKINADRPRKIIQEEVITIIREFIDQHK